MGIKEVSDFVMYKCQTNKNNKKLMEFFEIKPYAFSEIKTREKLREKEEKLK